jgi:hypothetical protein
MPNDLLFMPSSHAYHPHPPSLVIPQLQHCPVRSPSTVAARRALQLPVQMGLATGLDAVCIECKRVNPCHAPRLTPAPSSTDSPPSTPCCSPYGVELVVSASRGIDLRTTASGPDV